MAPLANSIPSLPPNEAKRDRDSQYRLADYEARRKRDGMAEGEAAIWEKFQRACAAIAGVTVEDLRKMLAVREQAVAELEAILPVPPPCTTRVRV